MELEGLEEFQRKYIGRSRQEHVSEGEEMIDVFFFQHGITFERLDPIVHWKHFVLHLKEKLETNVIFRYLIDNCAMYRSQEGIAENAVRITDEICSEKRYLMDNYENRKFRVHLIAHSFGGMYMRAAIPMMCKRGLFDDDVFVPFSFITLESPHCGIKKPKRCGPLDAGYRFLSRTLFQGKTIDQMKLTDKPFVPMSPRSEPVPRDTESEETETNDDLPFLVKMCDDEHLASLRRFKVLTLVQNIRFVYQMTYTSAAIDRKFPYSRSRLSGAFVVDAYDFDSSYTDIVNDCDRHYRLHEGDYDDDSVIIDKKDGCVLYNYIITRLNTLPWRRLNVHFRTKSMDDHFFVQGDMLRNKYFRNWRNDDVESYLNIISNIIKRDITASN